MKNKCFTTLSLVLSIVTFVIFFLKVEFNTPSSSIVMCWIFLVLALLLLVILSSYLTGVCLRSSKITVISALCLVLGAAVFLFNTIIVGFCILVF